MAYTDYEHLLEAAVALSISDGTKNSVQMVTSMGSLFNLHKNNNRATPEQYMHYKHALWLYKVLNGMELVNY